jgi:hypothetical protein
MVVLPALALAFAPVPAQAQIWLPIGTGLGGKIFVLLGSSSHCIAYTYDKNGNRVLVTSASVGSSAATGGSGSYGCFVWTQ